MANTEDTITLIIGGLLIFLVLVGMLCVQAPNHRGQRREQHVYPIDDRYHPQEPEPRPTASQQMLTPHQLDFTDLTAENIPPIIRVQPPPDNAT